MALPGELSPTPTSRRRPTITPRGPELFAVRRVVAGPGRCPTITRCRDRRRRLRQHGPWCGATRIATRLITLAITIRGFTGHSALVTSTTHLGHGARTPR